MYRENCIDLTCEGDTIKMESVLLMVLVDLSFVLVELKLASFGATIGITLNRANPKSSNINRITSSGVVILTVMAAMASLMV